MKSRDVKNVPHSVHDRLADIARSQGRAFQEVLTASPPTAARPKGISALPTRRYASPSRRPSLLFVGGPERRAHVKTLLEITSGQFLGASALRWPDKEAVYDADSGVGRTYRELNVL